MNNYFPHDSNARNSDKLLPIRMKYGAEGYGIYFMILERLRDEKHYMSVKDYNMLAFDLRVDASKVKAIVENFGLFAFTENGECFYSDGFNKRMEIKDEKSKKRSEAGKKGAEKRWQKKSNANGKSIALPLGKDSKESKVNNTKEEESKVNNTDQTVPTSKIQEEFAILWGMHPRKVGDQVAALDTYKNDVLLKDITFDQVKAKIEAYKKQIELNGTQTTYIKTAGKWFTEHCWNNEYDTTPPKAPKKPSARQEPIPKWAQPDYVAPIDEKTPEQEAVDQAKLDEMMRKIKEGRDVNAS